MDSAYADFYRQLYQRHWWWRSRERLLVDTLTCLGPLGHGQRPAILDIGCGDGFLFPVLTRFGDVWGIEPDPSLVSPDGPWSARITIGSFPEALDSTRRFDLIVMADVLEHLEDPVTALARAVELLTPQGRLVITVPAFQALWTQHDVLNHHRRRYTKALLSTHATSAGARVLESRYFFAWLAPLKLATRGLEAVFNSAPKNPTIPSESVNGLLVKWSRFEHRLSGRIAMPFGSSLLAILERERT
jgi:SAM-dependent methyltransferase